MEEQRNFKTCGNCGFMVPEEGEFCPNCGTKMPSEDVPESAQGVKKKSKKRIIIAGGILAAIIVAVVIVLTTVCFHDWKPATCIKPEYCSKCEETKGVALGHIWKEATCTDDQKCQRCGVVWKSALGHDWEEATCTIDQKCRVCGVVGEKATGHTPSDEWVVSKEARIKTEGEKVRKCVDCGEILETSTYSLTSYHNEGGFLFTPEEFKEIYEDKLNDWSSSFSYKFRENDDGSVGGGIFYSGKVVGTTLFSSNKNDVSDYISYDQRSVTVAKSLAFGVSLNKDSEVACTIVAFVEACDPEISMDDALDCSVDILERSEFGYGSVTRNGIQYAVGVEDDLLIIAATVDDSGVDI